MSVSTADLWKAILTAWEASSLPATFKALWSTSTPTEFFTLHDEEANEAQPWPYCVLDEFTPSVGTRMSGTQGEAVTKREIRDVRIRFNVWARDVEGDSRTSKEIVGYLVEEVMKVFGGHPTTPPSATISLTHGNHLITQYITDFGMTAGDQEHQWVLDYNFRLDVPVAIA